MKKTIKDTCTMCEAYRDNHAGKNCPDHESLITRIWRKLRELFDPSYWKGGDPR